jgi:hypothetical protein
MMDEAMFSTAGSIGAENRDQVQRSSGTQLLCYTYPSWAPRIRPAGSRREWMDKSPERFAYRCLPLAIANAHGWEVLSPCGFEARWDGGSGTEAVEIRLDAGVDPVKAPVSLFGLGTITFHVEGILRTSPGWNLWIGGPPNSAKDGLSPLAGVVETDWSPYSFTMNWRFTRSNHWVRFEENEPFCFFFPVERQALEVITPRVVPIEYDRQLKQEFEAWSRSRDTFQHWVSETNPSVPADKWQKLYYRGLRPDGSAGAADHSSKLRLRPFVGPDGKEIHVHEQKARETNMGGEHTESRGNCPQSVLSESQSADHENPPSFADTTRDSSQLRRRDWILRVMERQRQLTSSSRQVERVRNISSETFLQRYYSPMRPVVIEGELSAWPALTRWDTDYLKQKVGGALIEYQGGRTGGPDFELYKDNYKKQVPFDTYLDLIASGSGNDAYITAYNSGRNSDAFAVLQEDTLPLDRFLRGAAGMMWLGPAGTFTPLHYDLTNNLIVQVRGSKRIILLPPSETGLLYNERHVFSEVHDVTDESRFHDYPLAAQAQKIEIDLEAGDILYVPVGWWHQVTATDFSITFTYTDFLWDNEAYRSFPFE